MRNVRPVGAREDRAGNLTPASGVTKQPLCTRSGPDLEAAVSICGLWVTFVPPNTF